MRVERDRTKKLVVAFHFQFANQAGWKCDDCRKNGLEKKRRCGWLSDGTGGSAQVVWARKRTSVSSCPTSYITGESIALLEEFHAWKLFGAVDPYLLPARLVEAIFILEGEFRAERNDEHN